MIPTAIYNLRVRRLGFLLGGLTGFLLGGPLGSTSLAAGQLAPGQALVAQEVAIPIGSQAPAASLQDLDGNPVQLLDFLEEGKPALLEFWASWCENCEALEPQMEAIQERFGDRVSVVAVAVAVSQSQRRVKRHVEEQGASYPYLWDGKGEAVRAYQVPGTSVVVIVDADGKVVYTGSGASQNLVGEIERLVGG